MNFGNLYRFENRMGKTNPDGRKIPGRSVQRLTVGLTEKYGEMSSVRVAAAEIRKSERKEKGGSGRLLST